MTRPAGRRRRLDRAAPGAARRRLLRHLGDGRGRAGDCGSSREDLRRSAARWARGADRARRELVRPARERAGDRLPGRPVGRPVRSVRLRAARRSPTPSARWPTASAHRRERDRVLPLGRRRSGAAAPATTPTARSGSCAARSACSPTRSPSTAGQPLPGAAGRAAARPGGRAGSRLMSRDAARQPDRVRRPRPLRRAAARADPARRLGLPDHRRRPRCRPTLDGSPAGPSTPARRWRCC